MAGLKKSAVFFIILLFYPNFVPVLQLINKK
jgi:hypothetical protein